MEKTRKKSTENVDSYMNDISKFGRITTEEEVELADTIKNKTGEERQQAIDRLVCANLRLVVKIAHDFKNYGIAFDDLVAEGNLGLLKAAEKFDPSHNAKFSYYASWWIKQAMRHAIAWNSRIIRVPGSSAQRLIHINKAEKRFIAENGRMPTDKELAELTGNSEVQIAAMKKSATEVLSLDEAVNNESDSTFEQMMAETMEDECQVKKELSNNLHEALSGLSELDNTIVSCLFGIGRDQVDTKALAQEIGMTVSDLQERLGRILADLKDCMVGVTRQAACSA